MPHRKAAALAILLAAAPARASIDPVMTAPAESGAVPRPAAASFLVHRLELDGSRVSLTCDAVRDTGTDALQDTGNYRLHIDAPHGSRNSVTSAAGVRTYVRIDGKGKEVDLLDFAGGAIQTFCAPFAKGCSPSVPKARDSDDFLFKGSVAAKICADEILNRQHHPARPPGTDRAATPVSAP